MPAATNRPIDSHCDQPRSSQKHATTRGIAAMRDSVRMLAVLSITDSLSAAAEMVMNLLRQRIGDAGYRFDVLERELGHHLARGLELALAAVDQHQVRPVLLVALGVLLEGAAEAARQHLAHHGEVVAGGALALDVELAVAVLDEAVGARDDH